MNRSERKSYGRDPKADAALIAAECIMMGKSTGWSGELVQLEAVEAILTPFNIQYVDDMRGEWKPRSK